ncbi:MAG: hypothetical protein AAF556_04565, partial [Pseudomonadota bacterium]
CGGKDSRRAIALGIGTAVKTRPGICRRKKTFAAREDAERVAANAPFKLRAYRCGLCRKRSSMPGPNRKLLRCGATARDV